MYKNERQTDKFKKLTLCQFNPHLAKIYYTHLDEIPDKVKNHPPRAQRAWMITFNTNLARYGDSNFAFKAAWKALENIVGMIKRERSQIKDLAY